LHQTSQSFQTRQILLNISLIANSKHKWTLGYVHKIDSVNYCLRVKILTPSIAQSSQSMLNGKELELIIK
jgi:hypothetical protein